MKTCISAEEAVHEKYRRAREKAREEWDRQLMCDWEEYKRDLGRTKEA